MEFGTTPVFAVPERLLLTLSASSSSLIALSRMVLDKEIGSDSQRAEFNLPDIDLPVTVGTICKV